jgi:predicted AlkP superfamily phosphohydrolase/phosphomutase
LKKVIVIGLDGLEPTIVEWMLAAGELPNLDRLRAAGGFSCVATTTPAQTPVAWSSFATGTNPGGHGIFDFIRRDPQTYLPDLALNRYESRGAFLAPRPVNMRGGQPVWEVLSKAGITSTILRFPVTYPPDVFQGKMLSGMGVPDLRGGLGTPTFYTSANDGAPRESENLVRVCVGPGGTIETHLIGPRHPRDRSDVRLVLTVKTDHDSGRAIVYSSGEPAALELRVGEWSDWLRVRFKVGMLQSVRGLVRFHLIRLQPTFELHASPVNFDAEAPLFPISHPNDYAAQLARAIGAFHTTGMVEDHTGINNERIDEEAFLDQCDLAWREREAMMLHELESFDQGLFFCLFDTPDRVQHIFWRFRELGHPANRVREFLPEFARVIEDHYRRADEIVGKALQFADAETLVIVLSDHGFGSFRRGVNLNTLLFDAGLLALKDGARPGPHGRDFLLDVDWTRTSAYALGLGGIYLNLEGREGQGTVEPEAARELKTTIARLLAGLIDADRGKVAIRRVRTAESVYSGPFVAHAPDLLVDFAQGYRASWGTSLGAVPASHFEDNTRKWSGDHIIDPELVPGVLFMNHPFRADGASLIDLAPTILAALGVPRGSAMEGRSLLPATD